MKKNLFPGIDRLRRELRAHIDQTGLEDGQFAEKAGIASNTLSMFLSGRTEVPKMDFFLRLIQFTDFRPWFMSSRQAGAVKALGPDGSLTSEVTDAIQTASQMVENFIEAIPEKKRRKDSQKKGAFIAILANLQVTGQQEKIPELLAEVLAAFQVESTP